MRVVFMGTPEFAVPSLSLIEKSKNHEIVCVVTTADKPKGRGRRFTPSPVKSSALLLCRPFLQPQDLKDPYFIQRIQNYKPDIFVVVAYRILPEQLFSIPRLGSINLHASLLPQYRGAAPIQWAIMNGEKSTGLTTFQIDKGIDTGKIMLQEKIDIKPGETAGELSIRMAESGANLIVETLDMIEAGTIEPKDQLSRMQSNAPKITSDHLEIDWDTSAEKIVNKIHGLSPVPGAYFLYNGVRIRVFTAKIISDLDSISKKPGTVICADSEKGLIIRANNEDYIQILEVQREGKNRMSVDSMLRGMEINSGDVINKNPKTV